MILTIEFGFNVWMLIVVWSLSLFRFNVVSVVSRFLLPGSIPSLTILVHTYKPYCILASAELESMDLEEDWQAVQEIIQEIDEEQEEGILAKPVAKKSSRLFGSG